MSIVTRTFDYLHDGATFDAYLTSVPDALARPTVLIAHAWAGRTPFEEGRAQALAELGYTALAIDVYGKGVRGGTTEQNAALMQPLVDDRGLLQGRMVAALEAARAQPEVHSAKVAAIGYCFGGLAVLDLARCGADVAGVASFHGILTPPGNLDGARASAKVLVLHGYDDPMAPPEAMNALARELSAAGVDWQIHAYGHTLHSFSMPGKEDADLGIRYSATAERRSWQALKDFLAELFD
jgi:dienelactone hydrolase